MKTILTDRYELTEALAENRKLIFAVEEMGGALAEYARETIGALKARRAELLAELREAK